jgi:chromosome segregation ATPase
MPERRRISGAPDALVKLLSMTSEQDDLDGLRSRSEQAIGDLAQALVDSPVLENALAAAFGAREKAQEAQQAAMSALNLPSATDVERLERRLRSFSQRLEDVEEQIDEVAREISEMRRKLAKPSKKATQKSKA